MNCELRESSQKVNSAESIATTQFTKKGNDFRKLAVIGAVVEFGPLGGDDGAELLVGEGLGLFLEGWEGVVSGLGGDDSG